MQATTNKPVFVKQCNHCPFAYYGNQGTSAFCTYYDYADYDLGDVLADVTIPRNAPAPSWCPLRTADIYVSYDGGDL